ncbi:MAG: phosphotransferase [Clostridiales bacterium]|nr:phosphotransferase [Clostridiales bacterium]
MNEQIVAQLFLWHFLKEPKSIHRCGVGIGNFVYIVDYDNIKYVVRCSEGNGVYDDTVYWLEKLSSIDIPVPKVIERGRFLQYEYIVLTYISGTDIGLVYQGLSTDEKRKIAKDVVKIQNRVAELNLGDLRADWRWDTFIKDILDRAKKRIAENGYFSIDKVEQVQSQMKVLNKYFASVKPTAYLDDISTKNLLICDGKISGIIDIDWIGIGDCLTFAALTKMALLDLGYDTDYVTFILEEMQPNKIEKIAFDFYTLMYCVDFMGERGTIFMDKTVEVNDRIVERLNQIYHTLWDDFVRDCETLD